MWTFQTSTDSLQENEVNDTSKKDLDISLPKDLRYAISHPKELIIGDTQQGVRTRYSFKYMNNIAFILNLRK